MLTSPFDQRVNVWFDALGDFGKEDSELKNQIVELAKSDTPNRRRLEKMIGLLKQLPTELRDKLVTHAEDIVGRNFSGRGANREFRNTYNQYSRWQGQCSATSEFFSMIQQAITYND